MAKTGYIHMMVPVEQYQRLRELKDLLHARTWGELVDKLYEIITSETLEKACLKIYEEKLKKPPILQAIQA